MSSVTTLKKQIKELREKADRVTNNDGVVYLWVDEGETKEDALRKREEELSRKLNAEEIVYFSWGKVQK